MIVTVYTDGSCDNMTGKGGYGIVMSTRIRGTNHLKKHHSKKYHSTTSNRMEMKAILKSLQLIDAGHKIDIHSDSQYCVNMLNKWLPKLISSGKLMSKSNPDLWMKIWMKYQQHIKKGSSIHFIWIRGHNGNAMNEMADKLANKGRCQASGGIHCKVNN